MPLSHTQYSPAEDGSLYIYSLPEADVPPWPDEIEHDSTVYVLDGSWMIPEGRAWKWSGAARYVLKTNKENVSEE